MLYFYVLLFTYEEKGFKIEENKKNEWNTERENVKNEINNANQCEL